jgi:hypothetical protein
MKSDVEVEGKVVAETDRAILVDVDGDEIWFPLSQVEVDYLNDDEVILTVPAWLARKLDLE